VVNHPYFGQDTPTERPIARTRIDEGTITFDAERLTEFQKGDKSGLPGMQNDFTASQEAGFIPHMVHHEWAHVMDPRTEEQFNEDEKKLAELADAKEWGSSDYAIANSHEAYAEARAEWELRGGKTDGIPALEYCAERYNWGGEQVKPDFSFKGEEDNAALNPPLIDPEVLIKREYNDKGVIIENNKIVEI
jgi:hypothetical protein